MTKPMKLRCRIYKSSIPEMYDVVSKQFEGTEFRITVSVHDIQLSDSFVDDSPVDGWVNVEHMAQQGHRVTITLPAPSLNFGRTVSVSEYELAPRHQTIEDFGVFHDES